VRVDFLDKYFLSPCAALNIGHVLAIGAKCLRIKMALAETAVDLE
jgi:hypothetical protein